MSIKLCIHVVSSQTLLVWQTVQVWQTLVVWQNLFLLFIARVFNRSHDLLFIDIKTMYLGEMILPGIKREYGNWLASEMLESYLK